MPCGELLEALYPERCPLCGTRAPCGRHALAAEERVPRCELCSRALPPMLPDQDRCAACRRRRPRYHRLLVLGDYRARAPGRPALREWVLALKHGGRRDLARPLGALLAARLRAATAARVLLVPVPLHPLRRLARGYDQAALLARGAGEVLGAPVRRLLARTRWTPPQGAVGTASRSANVGGAFAPAPGARADLLGVPVWLVDDVVTSGATAEACVRILATLGARRVSVLALARADQGLGAQRWNEHGVDELAADDECSRA